MIAPDLFAEIEQRAYAAVLRGVRRAMAETLGAPASSGAESEAAPAMGSGPRRAAPPAKKRGKNAHAPGCTPADLKLPAVPLDGLSLAIWEALKARPRSLKSELAQQLAQGGLEVEPDTLGRHLGSLRAARYVGSDGAPGRLARYFVATAKKGST